MWSLAVGVPVLTGPAQGWNFWPVLAIPIALLVAYRWLDLPRSGWVVVGAILAGLLAADAVSSWGVVPAVVLASLFAAAATLALRRSRRGRPPAV
jgi:hypothetical protein